MTFLEVLKIGRPFRLAHICTSPWIVIGSKQGMGTWRFPLIRIDTGEELTLNQADYLSDKWEAMT